MGELLKGVLIDLRARNFVHTKTSLHPCYMHAHHCARDLPSPPYDPILLSKHIQFLGYTNR